MTSWKSDADAIVNMFLAGEATGHAWADVLFGKINPSGKLPVTFPDSYEDAVAPCAGTGNCVYSEGLAVGYRGLDNERLSFPFGHGLSYTSFSYDAISSVNPCSTESRALCFKASVTNSGAVDGAEVVQVYLTYPEVFQEPPIVLRGFEKVMIAAGATVEVTFQLTEKDMSIWNTDLRKWSMASGEYTVHVGASSGDLRLQSTFAVEGDIDFPPDNGAPMPGDDDDTNIEFEKFAFTGCSNWQDITIIQYEPGQGNCAAFCILEPECAAYNYGILGQSEYAGICTLFREGCQQQADPNWDLYVVKTESPPSPTSSPPGQCVAEFQQCGGQDWTGSTNCCNGMRCMQSNQWWSGCFP